MKTYQEIVSDYRKRQRDTLVDTLASSLTYADEIAVESGLLEDTGIINDVTGAVCGALPFAIIAATEGTKVILKKKTPEKGARDTAFRMMKTGVAMGIGGAVTAAAGIWAGLPVTMGVRALFDLYKSSLLTGQRVQGRIGRLQEINAMVRQGQFAADSTAGNQEKIGDNAANLPEWNVQ